MSYTLLKPFTERQRIDFIADYCHKKGYKIEDTEQAMYALAPNEIMKDGEPVIDEEYDAKMLALKKAKKSDENLKKAYDAEENGTVLYKEAIFETNTANIAKLAAMAEMIDAGMLDSVQWLSKNDIQLELSKEDLFELGKLITEYTGALWNVQYLAFKDQIDNAQTTEELDEINIEY